MGLSFHRLIKRDLRSVLAHYEAEVGPQLAARFYREFEELARRIELNPRRFHPVSEVLRRANFPSFPRRSVTAWTRQSRERQRRPLYQPTGAPWDTGLQDGCRPTACLIDGSMKQAVGLQTAPWPLFS